MFAAYLIEGRRAASYTYNNYLHGDLLVLTCIFCILYLSFQKFRRHLRDIPGPFLAGFTSLWKTFDTWKGASQYTIIELHRRYGPLVRVGPKHISVADPTAIKVIYAAGNGFNKTAFYPIQAAIYQGKPLMNLFATRDEEYHSRIKRPIAHTYSMAALTDLEPKIDHVSSIFMRKLKDEYAEKGRDIDLGEWLQWYAFDVIGNLTFSRTLGFLEESRDVDNMIARIESFLGYSAVIGQIPVLHKFLVGNPLLPLLYPAIEQFNPAVNFAIKCLKQSESLDLETQGVDDFLSRFQNVMKAGTKGGTYGGAFGPADVVNHTSSNVLAGSDTTAIALRSIIHNLITTPLSYHRLQQEIDDFDQQGKLSDPVKEMEARSMPYLQAVIREGMRLHPSVGMLLERQVPQGGAIVCGKYFPEGTIVGMNPWVIGRDKKTYGNDCDIFRPERWLEASDEELRAMERASLAFGAGSRVCIGKNISMMVSSPDWIAVSTLSSV